MMTSIFSLKIIKNLKIMVSHSIKNIPLVHKKAFSPASVQYYLFSAFFLQERIIGPLQVRPIKIYHQENKPQE